MSQFRRCKGLSRPRLQQAAQAQIGTVVVVEGNLGVVEKIEGGSLKLDLLVPSNPEFLNQRQVVFQEGGTVNIRKPILALPAGVL